MVWYNRKNWIMNSFKDSEKKSHNIGWCSVCGWTHNRVSGAKFFEDGRLITKPICTKCRDEGGRYIVCPMCGEKKEDTLYPCTIKKRRFASNGTCNVILYLCASCRQRPHKDILSQLESELEEMCETCEHRFECFTSKHDNDTAYSVKGSDGMYRAERAHARKTMKNLYGKDANGRI